MSEQKRFDFNRASKLHALEHVVLGKSARSGGSVKSLLKALEGMIRDNETWEVSLEDIAVSMGCSVRTVIRATKVAEGAGLLDVWGSKTDGKKNIYQINWVAIFSLPGAVQEPADRRKKVTDRLANPARSTVTPPVTNCHTSSDKLSHLPVSNCHTSSDKLSHPGATDRNDNLTDNERPGAVTVLPVVGCQLSVVSGKRSAVGGGGVMETYRSPYEPGSIQEQLVHATRRVAKDTGRASGTQTDNRQPATDNSRRAVGHWAGHIDLTFPKEELTRLFRNAVEAGYLTTSHVDKVRFRASSLQCRTRPEGKQTGWFIKRIECGDWNYLDPKWVRNAIDRLKPMGIELTPEEIREVRTPRT